MPLQLSKSQAPLGHELSGVRIRNVSDEDFEAIRAAFVDYGVVFLRNQNLTTEEHLEFTRRFGPLAVFQTEKFRHRDHPEIFVVSNISENGVPLGMADAGEDWHSDGCYTETPPWASIMCALEVPERDGKLLGDTLFASMTAAYDDLTDELKLEIDGLTAVNSFAARAKQAHARAQVEGADESGFNKQVQQEREKALEAWPDVVHPLVRRHPVSGRKSLYVSPTHTTVIQGLPEDEAAELLDMLIEHVKKPKFIYRHKWQVGDVLLWDNAQTNHMATFDYRFPERRRMHRTTVEGTKPY